MTAPSWEELATLYANAAVRAEVTYREKVALRAALKAAYVQPLTDIGFRESATEVIDAASRASSDPRRKDAGDDAVWAREEARMYAALAAMARDRTQS